LTSKETTCKRSSGVTCESSTQILLFVHLEREKLEDEFAWLEKLGKGTLNGG
jgi:hypothetical protein